MEKYIQQLSVRSGADEIMRKPISIKYCVLFILLSLTASLRFINMASAATDKWIDYASGDFAGGSGTEEDPYLIDTARRLAQLAYVVNNDIGDSDGIKFSTKSYKLIKNIDLGAHEWISIGYLNYWNDAKGRFKSDYKPFNGIFEGNGHTISNLTGEGLFCEIAKLARVANLQLFDVKIEGGGGALVDVNRGGIVEGCTVSGRLKGDTNRVGNGGLVGWNDRGTIRNCSVSVCVEISRSDWEREEPPHNSTGGLVGNNWYGGIIENCSASGMITSFANYGYVGGLVGLNDGKLTNSKANCVVRVAGEHVWAGKLTGSNGIFESFRAVGSRVEVMRDGKWVLRREFGRYLTMSVFLLLAIITVIKYRRVGAKALK
jgi:hypothetical protein